MSSLSPARPSRYLTLNYFEPELRLENLCADPADRRARPVRTFVALLAQCFDEIRHRFDWAVAGDEQNKWNRSQQGDRLQILVRIIVELLEQQPGRSHDRARRGDEDRIAVGLGARHEFGCEIAGRSNLVLDNNRLPGQFCSLRL